MAPRLVVTYSGDAVDLAAPHTVHADGAELEWTKYTGPSGAPFDRYEIHRSATAPFTPSATTLLATIRDVNVTTFRDTTAAPGTAFTYKVVANTSRSNPRTVTLPPDGKSSKVLQPAAGQAADTYLSYKTAFVNCVNHGRWHKLGIASLSDTTRRPILRFDLRDVPVGVTVDSAVMSLWHPFYLPLANTTNAHRVTRDWEEGSGLDTTCTKDGATWYNTTGGLEWGSPGGDFDSAAAASVTYPVDESPRWHDFSVTSLVNGWLEGTVQNHGVLLKLADETPSASSHFN